MLSSQLLVKMLPFSPHRNCVVHSIDFLTAELLFLFVDAFQIDVISLLFPEMVLCVEFPLGWCCVLSSIFTELALFSSFFTGVVCSDPSSQSWSYVEFPLHRAQVVQSSIFTGLGFCLAPSP